MAAQELKIQSDYWTGTDCLKNEIPWIVPGAVHKLAEFVRPADIVIDIGTGGSTLFYAKRCRFVMAIETNPEWAGKVRGALAAQSLTNVKYFLATTQDEVEDVLRNKLYPADIVSVDSVHGYSRSRFLDIVAPKCHRLLLLDNYAAPELFDTHHDKSVDEIVKLLPEYDAHWFANKPVPPWHGTDFNDEHWCGKGTRVICR